MPLLIATPTTHWIGWALLMLIEINCLVGCIYDDEYSWYFSSESGETILLLFPNLIATTLRIKQAQLVAAIIIAVHGLLRLVVVAVVVVEEEEATTLILPNGMWKSLYDDDYYLLLLQLPIYNSLIVLS
jgi:hypothetical protein